MNPVRFVAHLVAASVLLLFAILAAAHPLGNNTVNRQARLDFTADRASVEYRLDLAELRTLAASEEADRDGDGTTSDAEWRAWRQRLGVELCRTLELRVDGQRLPLRVEGARLRLQPGEAALPVLQADILLSAALPPAQDAGGASRRLSVSFDDHYREHDAGWRELYVDARDRQRVAGAIATRDRSAGLTRFPDSERLVEGSARFVLTLPGVRQVPSRDAALTRVSDAPVVDPAGPRAAAVGPDVPVPTGSISRAATADFLRLGMHHIATGWDHLVFLLGLLLVSRRLGEILRVVTAFSLAHSATLMASAAGWVSVPGPWVEALIALTIAYVGALALARRASGHGIWLAFLFGLVHGFGFAGALAETLGALETGGDVSWLWRLAAFNLGIEIVQVALVLLALTVFRVVRQMPWRRKAHALASASVLASGLVWFVSRLSLL
ncbi:MAG TPA: HupE/UreJ family protein [Rhodocyclaceae bacterium]|uniref:HupE/UreJ family protein n=1 Tax=Zoogloea sp. TaxID=49181 RepID=UPI002B608512|nr:HupE/UreJ family protein [Zoogloea sp.]HMV63505.1 HupE/UreJ family protein [Rhodocyclaceae bacterium]HMW52124.1 HupE/UreJ family protein [Rhodocyclaceae bacterium]HMY48438.1 HupE/UreJ family protein [Rhodocyclaceae bacterium]HMZ75920.1 HupE/UreJ family protein [Rhodocyclaceae bacterium]HNA67968.1 HupE/UreJ family protein [Rhodocyclaceae bacterium]